MNPIGDQVDDGMDAVFDELFDVEVIDMEQVLGLSIDRDSNNRIAYNRIQTNKKMFRSYVPHELKWGDALDMTMRLVVKMTTPVKLNLRNKEN